MAAARSKARKRALDILFESEVRGAARSAARSRSALGGRRSRRSTTTPASLVRGIAEHQLAHRRAGHDVRRGLDARPDADRSTATRCGIGVYEMLYVDEVPDAVAVSEAMSLVRDLSTDESPSFVNGVLGNIVRNKPALSA